MFSGFDDEVLRYLGEKNLYDKSALDDKFNSRGNSLDLSENELIEITGGNLVDLSGNILDLNYQKVLYGSANRKTPVGDAELAFDRAKRISRRGVGWHFQLSTRTNRSDSNDTKNNFIFDIDKEGVLKVNIPSSSDTGNVMFPSSATFDNDNINVRSLNPSKKEFIPVTLMNSNSDITFPNKLSSSSIVERDSGSQYSNSDSSPYFQINNSSPIRINSTRYHNMYAAAERLLANRVDYLHIPNSFVGSDGFPAGNAYGQPFEIPIPSSDIQADTLSGFPSYMSVVGISTSNPAIYAGGDVTVAGKYYSEELNPPYSNSFESKKDDSGVSIGIVDESGDEARAVGGKSLNFSSEGSIDMSIGADNFDKKSLVLDTEGSLVAWLGKDKNDRSLVMQSDGDILINVGGS